MAKKKVSEWQLTDEEIQAQLKRSLELGDAVQESRASDFKFDRKNKTIQIDFPDGTALTFPTSKIKELRGVSDDQIEQGYLTPRGNALHWDNLDAHYTIAGFVANIFGTREWMQELGREGGRRKSTAKTLAARLNGMRGGRPRKIVPLRIAKLQHQLTTETFAHEGSVIFSTPSFKTDKGVMARGAYSYHFGYSERCPA